MTLYRYNEARTVSFYRLNIFSSACVPSSSMSISTPLLPIKLKSFLLLTQFSIHSYVNAIIITSDQVQYWLNVSQLPKWNESARTSYSLPTLYERRCKFPVQKVWFEVFLSRQEWPSVMSFLPATLTCSTAALRSACQISTKAWRRVVHGTTALGLLQNGKSFCHHQ